MSAFTPCSSPGLLWIERNGKLKHSDEVVTRAKELHESGLGSRKIAKLMGLSRGTVYGYIKRKRRQTTALGGATK